MAVKEVGVQQEDLRRRETKSKADLMHQAKMDKQREDV